MLQMSEGKLLIVVLQVFHTYQHPDKISNYMNE